MNLKNITMVLALATTISMANINDSLPKFPIDFSTNDICIETDFCENGKSTFQTKKVDTYVNTYYNDLSYNSNSYKKNEVVKGVYTNSIIDNHIFEFNYFTTTIDFKSPIDKDIKQEDLVLTYAYGFKNLLFKGGFHNINTNDNVLRDGYVISTGISASKLFNQDILTYGVEFYISKYKNGTNLENINKNITAYQLSSFINFSKIIKQGVVTNTSLKINMQKINNYSNSSYNSFEFKNSLFYNKYYTVATYLDGEMRTGVRNEGLTVYNSLDKIKKQLNLTVGYSFTNYLDIDITYGKLYIDEYNGNDNVEAKKLRIAISYLF